MTMLTGVAPISFGEVYENYSAFVYRLVYRKVNNPTIAEDIVGEVWEYAFKCWNDCIPYAVGGWLFKVTQGRLSDWFRNESKNKKVSIDGYTNLVVDGKELYTNGERYHAVEDMADMKRYIMGLNDSERDAMLTRLKGYDNDAEAAKSLGISENAFRVRIWKARQHLKKIME